MTATPIGVPTTRKPTIDGPARRALALLIFVGVVTHVAGLTYPRQVVFDEVHWGKSVSAYCCTGQRLFDVHPPHGKLLLALGAKLGGYDGSFSFERIGQPFTDQPVFFLRLVPAIAGILIPPLFFLFLRHLGGSFPAALLGGLLIALDNAFLLESRLLLFDCILVASILGSLVCLLAADRASSRGRALVLTASSGALAGLATGTKFTGLVAIALISIYLATRIYARRNEAGRRLLQWLIVGGAAAAVYVAGWAIHFAVLPNPGPADAFHPTTGRFLEDFWVAHKTMLAANFNLATPHPDSSAPWTWPLMKVAPYFWVGTGASMYLVGNPVLWWGASLLFVVTAVNTVLLRVTTLRLEPSAHRSNMWLPFIGYVISFVPFFGITRVLFLYHYLTPLVFSLAFVLLWLDRAGWIRPERLGGQRRSYYATIALAAIAFLLLSPLTYGFSAGHYDEWLATLVRSWR